MLMGDLVLLETEINPVMAKLIENGIEITAVHNHLLRANPATFYMHVGGHGDAVAFGVPRRDPIMEDGMAITPVGPLGAATGINFQPTGGGKAAITGDFVLAASEVNPVIKALRANGIEVTALHSHMLDEQPRLFFMHFWANDDAVKLAKGLRAALDHMALAKG
jgi:biotin operon repressor